MVEMWDGVTKWGMYTSLLSLIGFTVLSILQAEEV